MSDSQPYLTNNTEISTVANSCLDNEKDCDEPLRLISLVINLLRHSNPSNFKRIKMVELLVLNYITDCSVLNIWQLVQGCNINNAIIENIEDEFKL